MPDNLPTVSVIIPARDAVRSLDDCLRAIADQDYPNIVDVVVAAADTGTREAAERHGVAVVENPGGATPTGLNRAIEASSGEIVIRVDAHSVIPPDYVSKAVSILEESGADNVGGMQVPSPGSGFWERAIAFAMSSPVGAGAARHRIGGRPGPSETVYLGAYRRSTLEKLRGFDERFIRHQDFELNQRIRDSGGTVWFDPALKVEYRPRPSLRALARQYFQYGTWKRVFSRMHPSSLSPRQLGPPILVIAIAASLIASVSHPLFLALPGLYLLGLLTASIPAIPKIGAAFIGVPAALATMHFSWGLGFLLSQTNLE